MRLASRVVLLLLLVVGSVAAQSKDDEETVDSATRRGVEGSGNAPSDDEDTVEGSGLPPSQVYTKQTTVVHARPVVQFKTTSAPEVLKKKELPAIINMDAVEKEQREKEEKEKEEKEKEKEKEREKEQSVSIAPAIPRITTNRPDTGFLANTNIVLIGILALIVLLIIVVVVIIVVCRRKHKSDYTPARQDPPN